MKKDAEMSHESCSLALSALLMISRECLSLVHFTNISKIRHEATGLGKQKILDEGLLLARRACVSPYWPGLLYPGATVSRTPLSPALQRRLLWMLPEKSAPQTWNGAWGS